MGKLKMSHFYDPTHNPKMGLVVEYEECPKCGEPMQPIKNSKGARFACENENCAVIEVRHGKDGKHRVIKRAVQ